MFCPLGERVAVSYWSFRECNCGCELHYAQSSLLRSAVVEAGVVTAAALLICGRGFMCEVPGAVLRGEYERTGRGYWGGVSFCEEGDGGPSRHTEQRRRGVIGTSLAGG